MNGKIVAIVTLSLSTVLFMCTTVFFIFGAVLAQENFEDQVRVTQLTIQGFDSVTDMDFDRADMYMEDAMELQKEILERNGLDSL